MAEPAAADNAASTPSWRNLDQSVFGLFPLTVENFLALVLVILAVATRLYGLEDRVASHDEVNHFVPSYDFSQGMQFRFDPMTHGPLQMHLIALSFVALGDNDFTARLPAALFSIATVAIALFLFRPYLGRRGALIAGALFLISPYMLYYGRYQRNEAFIVVWVLLTIYAILRYLERGEWGTLVLFTAVNALHFTEKATGYIYAGGQVVFLIGLFLIRLARRSDVNRLAKIRFFAALGLSAFLFAGTAYMWRAADASYAQNPDPAVFVPAVIAGIFGLAAAVVGVVLLMQDAEAQVRQERSFDLIVLLGTLVLPLTSAVWMISIGRLFQFPMDPIDMNFAWASNLSALFDPAQPYLAMLGGALPYILVPTAAAVGIGLWWKRKEWWILALVFFGIFAFFFTTVLTNPGGLLDGLIRYLGYWIVQHGEERASQPWFYYLLIQIPIYEYLPAIGAVTAFLIMLRRRLWQADAGKPFQPAADSAGEVRPVPAIPLFLYFGLFSLAIFSYAGEKMPQQTMLIAAPMILAAAWALGWILETKPVGATLRFRKWSFEIPASAAVPARHFLLAAFAVLGLLTARTAYFATYINYDYPNEYMAYAHGAPGPKIALEEIERISRLTTGGTDLVVAYDNYVRYPYWWYLRHYPKRIDFGESPGMDIRQAGIVVVGEQNNLKVVPILGDDYVRFEQMRMWWHNQDYWGLKWDPPYIESEYLSEARANGVENPPPMSIPAYLRLAWGHISPIFVDPQARLAALQIWFNRDFSGWGMYTGKGGYSYQDWSLAERLYIYFRKDLLDHLGGAPESAAGGALTFDPYELSWIDLVPDFTVGYTGAGPGEFFAPRGIALAPDGSLYVADSMNHRIQHLDSEGTLLRQWGSFGSIDLGQAPGGTFNEPWGIGLGPDGSVYVADTWNHRVQKFTAEGEFLAMWGAPISDTEAEITFYGPRTIAVDAEGRVFVADTGNKRVAVFTADGEYLTEFGTPGAGEGQLDEPVGLAVDDQGRVFVADTWNRRVQIFAPEADGSYTSAGMWDVNAWFGTTAEIKPFLALDANRHVYLTDPSTCRILEFTERGVILNVWGTCGDDGLSLNSPTGIAVDPLGGLWVSDSRHDRLVHYMPPTR
ncbi:MAG: SMP-30/gluconolactonase/LRE family protein [Anaerolineales bacterium]|nr:SMP-30/gluconolactonase/LRE family protein [Anaerolineales bacterium]